MSIYSIFWFFLLFLIILPIASATSIERKIEVSDIYFNRSGVYISVNKEYTITLTPTPYNDFDMPGYSITEYLPRGFTFISTNSDKHTLVDNKLQMLKFLPPNDNSTLIYKLQYKKEVDPIPSFYGTYLDENRNYGVITQPTSGVSSTVVYAASTPTVTYEKSTQDTVPAFSTDMYSLKSEFIPLSASPVAVVSIQQSSSMGILIFVILFIIVGTAFMVLKPSYHKVFEVMLLGSGDVIIDKKAAGIITELNFELITKSQLSVKVKGNISKVVTSIQEISCDNRCFVITITPDGKDHSGMIIFTKKNTKNMKYKIKRL